MTAVNGMPMYSESDNTGFSIHATLEVNDSDILRIGTELQRYRLDDWWPASGTGMMSPNTFENIDDGERDRYAVFAELESQAVDNWQTLVGVRYERVSMDADEVNGYAPTNMMMSNQLLDSTTFNVQDRSVDDDNIDATLLARYSHNENLDIEFGLARKVRSPNLYERYTWSTWTMAAVMNNTVGDGNGYIGDIDLDPEKAYTVSATFDWHASDRSWELQATPYYTRVDDYIDAAKRAGWAANQFNVLQYVNSSARLYGIDIAGKMPLGRSELGSFGLQALLNYTDGENRDTGDNLYNIMPLNVTFTVTQQVGSWDNALEWKLVDSKDDVNEVRNETQTPGYGLVDLRLSHSWKKVRVGFGVDNMFDKFYYLPTGGAYTAQGSTMGVNNIPWGIGVPGTGRSFYASLNVSF
ncbi:MAG: TonB-dependent receptor [Motiliproteus sp.]|nr:TonB-dependent receptor [Motiliproteus sp.]MCW9051685.1 TonB-dependent receptor [Motiliproteus sp.]